MFEKNMSCESRVVFAALAVLFLLTALFGKLFAIIGLVMTVFVAVTGVCMGAKILGPAFCKKSVTDAIEKAADELKSAADEAVDKAKDVADDVVDKAKDVADDAVDSVKDKIAGKN